MTRLVSHKTALKKIIKDDRLSPHRRLLAELFHLWLDCDDVDYKKGIFEIIQATYGSAKRISFEDTKQNPLGKIGQEATDMLRDFFAKAQEDMEEIKDEISTADISTTSE